MRDTKMRPSSSPTRPGPLRFVTAIAAVALVAGTTLPTPRAHAQDEQQIGHSYRVANHSAAWQRINDFKRYAGEDKWHLATRELQELLDLPPERGLVVEVKGARPRRFEGVRHVAQRMFAELPPAGREAWEEQYREAAEKLLSRGLRLRRIEDLRLVARRYPARDLRRRALDGLARLGFARGDFFQAAHDLQELAGTTEGPERAAVLARLALARSQIADRAGTLRVIESSQGLEETPVPGPSGTEPLRRFLSRMHEAAGPAGGADTGWRQFGGNPHGTGLSETPPQPEKPAWRVPLGTNFKPGTENDNAGNRAFGGSPYQGSRPSHPMIAQGTVYVNGGQSLIAADLSTGSVRWRHDTACDRSVWRDNLVSSHTSTIDGDVVFAALATRSVAPQMDRQFYGRTIVYALPHRVLHAFDARSGRVLWNHAEEELGDREDKAEILAESVASPPLVVGSDVLVVTWRYVGDYDVRLVCFDRMTGRTRWRRKLVQGQQELNLFGRPVKELATPGLAELDGLVYVATGMGVAAAVDRADGEISWIAEYPQSAIPPSNHWYETKDRSVTWQPSSIAATRKAVIMAPLDGTALVSFEPRTGRTLWTQSQRQGARTYTWFLGTSHGSAYVLGKRLAAFDLETGTPTWRDQAAGRLAEPLQQEAPAVGRGLLTADAVYVPLADRILVLESRTGRYRSSWPLANLRSRPRTGDLVSGDGALLVVARRQIEGFYDDELVREQLERRLAKRPTDPYLRLEAGAVYRSAGENDRAIGAFTEALRLAKELPPVARGDLEATLRRALYDAYVERAKEALRANQLARALQDLELAVNAARDRGRAVEGLFLLARVAEKAGREDVAREALQRIVSDFPEVHTAAPESGARAHAGAQALLELGETAVRAGRMEQAVGLWLDLLERFPRAELGLATVQSVVRLRLEQLALAPDSAAGRLLRERARVALDTARATGDPAALDVVARLYPDAEISSEAGLLAASLHLEAGNARQAVGALSRALRESPGQPVTARALWQLAHAYRQLGATVQERRTLERLIEEAPSQLVAEGEPARAAAERVLAEERFAASEARLPAPSPPMELLWEVADEDVRPPQPLDVHGRMEGALAGRILTTREAGIELREGASGEVVWRSPSRMEVRFVAVESGVVLLAGDAAGTRGASVSAAAFDAATGEELWRNNATGLFQQSATSLGVLYVLSSERGRSRKPVYKLTALDAATGEELAARRFTQAVRSHLTVADDALVLYTYSRGNDGAPPRTIVVLDAATLQPRGGLPLESMNPDAAVHPPGSAVVVTTDQPGRLVAVDLSSGKRAWTVDLPAGERRHVKKLLPVRGGVIVSDTFDGLRRLDAATGREVWETSLQNDGTLAYEGEAAAGGVVVATLTQSQNDDVPLVVVCLDDRTGAETWRATLPGSGSAWPQVCAGVVAYQFTEWLGPSEMRTRVVLLGREDGRTLQTIDHPRFGRAYHKVLFQDDLLMIVPPASLGAVYRGRSSNK